jgi:hypothetical protein
VGQALANLTDGLRQLARAGAAPPDVGMELTDENHRVLADAELNWTAEKLALLRPDQEDLADAWKAADWIVTVLDDGLQTVQGQPWQFAVAAILGCTLPDTEE